MPGRSSTTASRSRRTASCDTDEANSSDWQYGEDTAGRYTQGIRRGQYRHRLTATELPGMFQLVGSLLALLAILTALAGAPVAGTVFALLTFVWVIRAKPRQARSKDDAPPGVVYEAPFSR